MKFGLVIRSNNGSDYFHDNKLTYVIGPGWRLGERKPAIPL